MTTTKWLDRTRGEDTVNAAAEKAGIVQSTLLRQSQRGTLGVIETIKIARAYGVNPLEPLLEAGLLREDDVRAWHVGGTLDHATDRELSDEVYRRMALGSAGLDITAPYNERPSLSVVDDIASGRAKPVAAKRPTGRNEQFEGREST